MTQAVSPAPDGGYPGNNTAEGTSALLGLTSGVNNTALGFTALSHDTSGSNNTAAGAFALFANTTGAANTATGIQALYKNTTGIRNTADGTGALFHNNGSYNSATGWAALVNNTTGTANTADGAQALYFNTTGNNNTAEGAGALLHNNGNSNTAVGWAALFSNTTGTQNTAVGYQALRNNTTATGNIALGRDAGTNPNIGSNNIYIGDPGFPGDTNVISIGGIAASGTPYTATYIGGIFGATVTGGSAVSILSDGHLGTVTSSKRFKDEIKPMDKASEELFALKPVTFHYKKEIDPEGIPQFGLVAEEVEKVNAGLVVRDKEGRPYSVRYDQVNAMLLNEFLKEHEQVQELRASDADQKKEIAELRSALAAVHERLKEHDAKIDKVNSNVELVRAK